MKTVFITGASRGIGKEVAKLFARKGWFVGLYSTDETALAKVSREVGVDVSCYKSCDVTDPDSTRAAIQHFAEQTNGRMDALVNNAGVLCSGPFEETEFLQFANIIDINIKGMTAVAHGAFPFLRDTPGSCLVNMCSASSIHGLPLLAVYSASKFYVSGLTEALNLEWHRHDIRVTSVKPPVVNTGMADQLATRLRKRLTVDLEPSAVADSVYMAVKGRNVGYIIGTRAQAWGLADKYLPWFARRAVAGWLTDSGQPSPVEIYAD